MRIREVFALISIGIIITSGLLISTSPCLIQSERSSSYIGDALLSFYNESSPISIDGDDDFAFQANANSWPGDGTRETPYAISGLNITLDSGSGYLINISNTDAYFQIENSLFTGGSIGIRFANVSFGKVINTSIFDCSQQGALITHSDRIHLENNTILNVGLSGYGIYLYEVFDSKIANNTIRNSGSRGLLVDYGSNCTFIDNSIFGNHSTGLYLRDSHRHRIHHNRIYDNLGNGITLGNSWHCNITENHIYDNGNEGISLQQASYSLVESNIIHDHPGTGIQGGGHTSVIRNNTVYGSGSHGIELSLENCTAEYNLLYDNSEAGVIVKDKGACIINNTLYNNSGSAIQLESNSTSVQYNNFIDNGEFLEFAQASDSFFENTIDNNYWSDWTFPDADHNLIVDVPYLLDGDAHNSDLHPRVFPYLDTRMHILSTPILQDLSGNAYYNQINITWGVAGDTFGHEIKYSLYYSRDGIEWVPIISDFDGTFFQWNITSVPDGYNYNIKIIASCSHGLSTSSTLINTFEIQSYSTEPSFPIIPAIIIAGGVIAVAVVAAFLFVLRKRKS